MPLKNIQIEKIAIVLKTLGESRHPMLAFRVAMLSGDIRPTLEALAKARTPSAKFQEFSRKHIGLCELNARKDANGNSIKDRVPVPTQNAFLDNYDIENVEVHQAAVAALEAEYNLELLKEAGRQQEVGELLNTPSELELKHKIKYSWCKGLLTGNAMAQLLQSGILLMDEEPTEDTEPVEVAEPAKAAPEAAKVPEA